LFCCSQHLEGCPNLLEEWTREHPVTLDEQGKPLQTAAKKNKEEGEEQQQTAAEIEGEQVVAAPTAPPAADDLAPPAEEKVSEGVKPSQSKVGRIRAP
jgi:hypothetical protein